MIMESSNLLVFTSEDLKSLTNNFSHNNLIGVTQFGKLYRGFVKPGFMGSDSEGGCVTVKIWAVEKSNCLDLDASEGYLMVKEEVQFLTQPSNDHPNLVKLIGFCCEREVRGVVYDLNPRATLHDLILRDDLSWIQRVKIVLQLARLLEFLHSRDKPYLVLNLSDSHIILDSDFNPKLCDFGLIMGGTNGEFYDPKKKIPMPIGYGDPYFAVKDEYRQSSSDVFALGVILLGLISKRVFEPDKSISALDNMVHCWAKKEYRPNCSLAHKGMTEDWGYHPEDGSTVTEVGMRCIEFFPTNRPAIKTVVERLERLIVLQRLGDNRPNKRDKKLHSNYDY